ncbi:hypothetical protein [Deinococcus humi]|uniref:Uncharacterized protein n=1 Tax=Deinococcus humi TaxID=662880 RepID=A0A7W8JT27_9DEIO|nr:hypothetical protein [Deinococcus humi]MBB5362691.1 hypothetical protein [Deinococcus humi]GGO31101.1 hypothetical protein GCM10008949_26560 [Deinococcus humi]
MTTAPQPLQVASAPAATYRATTAQHLITIALAWWLLGGLFLDGWAHNNLGESLETFFTPWHAVFYSGFLAVAGWCLFLASRGWQRGRRGLAAFPEGYSLAAIGVPLFGLGGLGDLTWHTVFGIEVGIEALLSPTHLLLFAGGSLIVASPLNAAWQSPTPRQAPLALRWAAVLSATSLLALTAFIHMYMWGLLSVPQGLGWVQTRGELSAVLLTALMLAAPVLLLIRRFALPFGAITVMYTLTNTAMALMLAPGDWRIPGVALACGLLADILCALLRPSPARVWAFWAFAFLLPLAVWVPYLGGAVRLGLSNLSLELWLGVAVMTGLGGLALSALLLPPALPVEILEPER